jgi:hypothetical protein
MMKQWSKQLFAISLVLLTVGSLTGCTVSRERTTERTVVPEEEAANNVEQPVATNDIESDTMEEPAVGTGGTTAEERNVSMPSDLQNLPTGRDNAYYRQQLESLGYSITNSRQQDNRYVYDVTKGGRQYQVGLVQSGGNNRAERIVVTPMEGTGTGAGGTTATGTRSTQSVTQQITNLQPGRKPAEYIPALERIGTVTEYRLRDNRADFRVQANNKNYNVSMNVDPNTQNVTTIKSQ